MEEPDENRLEKSINQIESLFGHQENSVEGRGKGFFSPHKKLGTKRSLRYRKGKWVPLAECTTRVNFTNNTMINQQKFNILTFK